MQLILNYCLFIELHNEPHTYYMYLVNMNMNICVVFWTQVVVLELPSLLNYTKSLQSPLT